MKETLFERLLNHFDINEEQYQKLIAPVTIDNFLDGHYFKGMDKAVNLVQEAVDRKDKIFIYGDYDADGIMSTSIVAKALLMKGLVPSFYIPNRYNDGYGITVEKAKTIVNDGVKLVITVDNGISAFEAIDYLKEHGIKVLIIDHHTIQEKVPNADAIIHPQYSEFGDVSTSAGFVSFMFSWAFLGRFDKYLSTLASISVISDMMPLLEYNRNFLRLVLKNFTPGEFYVIDLLREGQPFDENTIGMKIAPKINALGRLLADTSINRVVKFFVTPKRETINQLHEWIVNLNEERKQVGKDAEEAFSDVSTEDDAIVIMRDVKEGLLGLIANSICSKEHKPTIVFSSEGETDVLKGSGRAPVGFNIVDAFNSCGDILITSGGHALAGGCSIYKKDFEEFKKRFNNYVNENPVQVVLTKEVEIGLTEITEENFELIQSFSPFGECWKAPNFLLKRIKTDSLMFSKNGTSITTFIGQSTKLVGFGYTKDDFKDYTYVDFVGRLQHSFFNNKRSLDFRISEFKETK